MAHHRSAQAGTLSNNMIATIRRQAHTQHYATRRRNPHQSPLIIINPLVDPRIVIQSQSGAYAQKHDFPGPFIDSTCMYRLQDDSKDLEFTCNAIYPRPVVADMSFRERASLPVKSHRSLCVSFRWNRHNAVELCHD